MKLCRACEAIDILPGTNKDAKGALLSASTLFSVKSVSTLPLQFNKRKYISIVVKMECGNMHRNKKNRSFILAS